MPLSSDLSTAFHIPIQLAAFNGLAFEGLLSLDLSSNSFAAMDSSILPRSLKYLNLACNYLEHVSLSGLNQLETLILSYNSLTVCPSFLPSSLVNLDLKHNPSLSLQTTLSEPFAVKVNLKHLLIDERLAGAARVLWPQLLSVNDSPLFLKNVKIYSHPCEQTPTERNADQGLNSWSLKNYQMPRRSMEPWPDSDHTQYIFAFNRQFSTFGSQNSVLRTKVAVRFGRGEDLCLN